MKKVLLLILLTITCCLYASAQDEYVYVTASQSNIGEKAKVALSGSIPEGMLKEYGNASIGDILNELAEKGYHVIHTGFVGYANRLFSSFLLSKKKDNIEKEEKGSSDFKEQYQTDMKNNK